MLSHALITDLVGRDSPTPPIEVAQWCKLGLVSPRLADYDNPLTVTLEPLEAQIIRHMLRLVNFGIRPATASALLNENTVRLNNGEWRATLNGVSVYWRLDR